MIDDGDDYIIGLNNMKKETITFIDSPLPQGFYPAVFFGIKWRMSEVAEQE